MKRARPAVSPVRQRRVMQAFVLVVNALRRLKPEERERVLLAAAVVCNGVKP